MKVGTQRIRLLLALALLTSAAAARAQETKIGVVDTERALFSTEEGKKVSEEFKAKTRAAQAQMDPMVADFKTLRSEIESKRFVLSQDALLAKQSQLAELQNRIEAKNKELEGQLKIDQVRLIQPLQEKLKGVIDALGKEQGFALIIERNSGTVLYAREANDITDLVVSRFNAKK